MKIAVIIEGSTKHREADVVKAVAKLGHEVVSLGMKNIEGEPDLTYMETGLITALALNLKAVDFVVGGCGTGQGYMNAVLQFPGVACGMLLDPVDAFLFSQVNAGNCISLALNKGYGGIGADINVEYILDKLFTLEFGQGYPQHRAEIQKGARERMAALSLVAHKPMTEILRQMDPTVVKRALTFPGVSEFIQGVPDSDLKALALELATK